jgi:hypothetical protein
MPHMLPVPAVEFGNPIAVLVLMKPNNRSLGHLCRPSMVSIQPLLRNA